MTVALVSVTTPLPRAELAASRAKRILNKAGPTGDALYASDIRTEFRSFWYRARKGAPTSMNDAGSSQYEEWEDQAMPVLRWVKRTQDENWEIGTTVLDESDLTAAAEEIGVPLDRLPQTLCRLEEDRLITSTQNPGMAGTLFASDLRITGEGMRVLGSWPSRVMDQDALMQVLQHMIAQARSSDERTRLERLRDAVVNLSHETFVGVMTGVIEYQLRKTMG